jgi:hypothetical protein
VKQEYAKQASLFFKKLALSCAQNKIKYVPVSVNDNFKKFLLTYLAEKQNFG